METSVPLKQIKVAFSAAFQGEGDGAKVRRFIGVQSLPDLDPFLMLDMGRVMLPAGFPDHPHRGFETVSYILEGSISHEDSHGHKVILNTGDLQWLTTGKGVIHSDLPTSFTEPTRAF